MLNMRDIHFSYDKDEVLSGINLSLGDNEILGLVGESGSGKSTILRIIAGLEQQQSGEVFYNQCEISHTPTHKRDFGYIFQSLALFPHLTTRENLAFGIKHLKRKVVSAKVSEIAEMLRIEDLLDRYPHELSGGQKQRVAIGRTVVMEPKLILFDEPFSALDKDLRQDLREEIREILKKKQISAIIVTHDKDDVDSICDKVMRIEKTAK